MRVAAGMEEGDSVIAAAPSFRPFGRAEARFARGFMARLKSGPSGYLAWLFRLSGVALPAYLAWPFRRI
jgi:hypothetical protein